MEDPLINLFSDSILILAIFFLSFSVLIILYGITTPHIIKAKRAICKAIQESESYEKFRIFWIKLESFYKASAVLAFIGFVLLTIYYYIN